MTWTPAQGRTKRTAPTTHPAIGAESAKRASNTPSKGLGQQAHTQRKAESQRIIIVSNRGPVSYSRDPRTGRVASHPGTGGVVSGLLSATQDRPVSWVAVAMTDAERAIARGEERAAPLRDWPNISLRLVGTTADAYRRFYNG
ncbi:MAG TPA: hypothetical protein VF739_07420, partial [Ktedonobacterales bacterium]